MRLYNFKSKAFLQTKSAWARIPPRLRFRCYVCNRYYSLWTELAKNKKTTTCAFHIDKRKLK